MAYETTKALNPFYRDTLSYTLRFPDYRQYLPLISWAITPSSLNLPELYSRFAQLGLTDSSPAPDRAFMRMLEVIVLTNRVLQPTNTALNETEALWVRQAINEILTLAPSEPYLVNTALILLRLNAMDEFAEFVTGNWNFLAGSPMMLNLMGFISTIEGDSQKALDYFVPIQHLEAQGLPFRDLCVMSAQFAQGQLPESPVRFGSLAQRHTTVDLAAAQLPAMRWEKQLEDGDKTIAVVACDDAYFYEHAIALACSLHATNVDQLALHLHFYSPSEQTLKAAQGLTGRLPGLQLAITSELLPERYAAHKAEYFSCVRFIRSYELLKHYQKPLFLVDADALLRCGWSAFCNSSGITDRTGVAVVCPQDSPPWERVIAGLHYVAPTPDGLAFAADVAAFIATNFAAGTQRWFLDQIALSSVYEKYAKGKSYLNALSADALDLAHRPNTFVWAVTNHKTSWPNYNAYRAELAARYPA